MAEKSSRLCNARVITNGQQPVRLCILIHGPELVDPEWNSETSHPLLPKKNRPFRVGLDPYCCKQKKWQQADEAGDCNKKIKNSLCNHSRISLTAAITRAWSSSDILV